VQKIIARDRRDRFRFAPLQGAFAARVLNRHEIRAIDLDSVYLVLDPNGPHEEVLARSRAIAKTWQELGGFSKFLGSLILAFQWVAEVGYSFVAKNRYRWYGKCDACPIPTPEQRKKFLDL
jgi:predicted DCC family thiol-disulfide oxidoreductase YuxK